jgi:hypothetical protein
MYRTVVAVYSKLPDAPVLRRELEDSGVPPSQIHISTEADPVPPTGLAAHEPRGFTDWLFGVPENDLSFFQESLEAGRTIVKVHVGEELFEKVSQLLDRYGPITVDSAEDQTVPEGAVAVVRSYIVERPFEDLVREREELMRAQRNVRMRTAGADAGRTEVEVPKEPETVGSEFGTAPRSRR